MSLILAAISILLTVMGLLQAWLILTIKSMQRAIETLGRADVELGKELSGVRVLVAGSYVTREEFRNTMRDQTQTIVEAINRFEQRSQQAMK